ncbi:Protein of unknown function [Gryllus bimaculatus]|nr:Protein of unknown function [Gryllus bimaculatus]
MKTFTAHMSCIWRSFDCIKNLDIDVASLAATRRSVAASPPSPVLATRRPATRQGKPTGCVRLLKMSAKWMMEEATSSRTFENVTVFRLDSRGKQHIISYHKINVLQEDQRTHTEGRSSTRWTRLENGGERFKEQRVKGLLVKGPRKLIDPSRFKLRTPMLRPIPFCRENICLLRLSVPTVNEMGEITKQSRGFGEIPAHSSGVASIRMEYSIPRLGRARGVIGPDARGARPPPPPPPAPLGLGSRGEAARGRSGVGSRNVTDATVSHKRAAAAAAAAAALGEISARICRYLPSPAPIRAIARRSPARPIRQQRRGSIAPSTALGLATENGAHQHLPLEMVLHSNEESEPLNSEAGKEVAEFKLADSIRNMADPPPKATWV